MSMFQRSDKPAETNANGAVPAADAPATAAPEPKRPQATAQPLSAPVRAQQAAPSDGPGVSVISKALKITGQLESTEDIEIHGEVDGDVRGVSVKVGGNAKVRGTVYGEAVELAGTVDGCIEAKKVVLMATAHMSGDVVHQDIRIESGAYIDGHCKPEFGKSESRGGYSVPKAAATAQATNGAAKA